MTSDDRENRQNSDEYRGDDSRHTQRAPPDAGTPVVSVIIPCFNQAEYLGEAIESVLAQTCQAFEVVVIDDGSVDATPDVARRYGQVRYVRQANRGLSAARNAGIEAAHGRYLLFLDADDRLLPQALTVGLRCIEEHPDCAFVSGGHRRIDEAGTIIECPTPPQVRTDHYLAFLRGNYVGMHAAVMYRRTLLTVAGGFDETLPACEDYELYLRLARLHPVHCHGAVVAEYRTYAASMSRNARLMLPTVLGVLRLQRRHLNDDRRRLEAYRAGLRYWKEFFARRFATQCVTCGADVMSLPFWRDALAVMSWHAPRQFARAIYPNVVRPLIPTSLLRLAARFRGDSYYPAVGRIRFGDLRRVTPISERFGFDRGLPVDRYYIERFLAAHVDDIRGRVLEIGGSDYTRRFGRGRVTKSDVLHVADGNPSATFIGDLTSAEHVPSDAFDCAIITQTLHLIFDVRAALATLYRILKPGGVLLLTVPGISQISHDEWGQSWYWSFTSQSIGRLAREVFPAARIETVAHGNVLAATAFLQGLAAGEVRAEELDVRDPCYEVLITVWATKPTCSRQPDDNATPDTAIASRPLEFRG